MDKSRVTIIWDDPNIIEKGHKVYRSDTPMDTTDMPTPIALLDKNATAYTDNDTVEGQFYYYRIGVYTPVGEEYSEEVYQEALLPLYVYSGSGDNTLRKIDLDGNQVWSFDKHTSTVNSIGITQR